MTTSIRAEQSLKRLWDNPQALREHAQLCERNRDWPSAEKIFERLHALEPDAGHQVSMAATLYNQHRFQEALNNYNAYARDKTDAIHVWLDITSCLLSLSRLEEAVIRLRHWITLQPDDVRLHQALGFTLMHLGDGAAAEEVISHMLEKFPANPPQRALAGKHYLRRGDHARGFDYYRSRWAREPLAQPTLNIPCDVWDGQHFNGTLLVASEGNMEEEILSSSMFGDLAAMKQSALIECDPRLLAIFRRSFTTLEFVPRGHDLLATTCTIDSGSGKISVFRKIDAGDLGFHFRRDEEFPLRKGWLIADPEKVAILREQYRQKFGDKMRVGIARKCTNEDENVGKSISLSAFYPILSHADIVGINLQRSESASAIAYMKAELKSDIYNDPHVDASQDIDTLLAQIATLDLVVSRNNAAIHLAGALGIPGWLVLQKEPLPIWCWGYDHGHCQWYPTLEIFRVDKTLNDDEGIARVFANLHGRLDILLRTVPDTHACADSDTAGQPLSEQRLLATVRDLLAAHRPDQAKKTLRSALSLLNNNPDALLESAHLCQSLNDWETTEKIYRRLCELQPNCGFEHGLAAALFRQNRFAEALRWYRRYNQTQPDNTSIRLSIGLCLVQLGRLEEAAEQFQRGIAIHPSETLFENLLLVLIHLGDRDASATLVTHALHHFPASIAIRALAAQHYLRDGDYLRGFDDRWQRPPEPGAESASIVEMGQKTADGVWDGQRFDGTLLVKTQAVLGEEILVSSLFGDLVAMQQNTLIECTPRLLPVFCRSFPSLNFFPRGKDPRAANTLGNNKEYRVANTNTLGYHFRRYNTFPDRQGWLVPDPEKVAQLRERYRQKFGEKLRIGIGWKSARTVASASHRKNIDLNALAPLLTHPNSACISLQYGDISADIDRLRTHTGADLYVDPQVNATDDLDTLIAQIASLDLVISTSNSAVHMAGALGIPCWLLLRKQQLLMWCWGYPGTPCHWYPSIERFRLDGALPEQQALANIVAELRNRLDAF